MKLSRLFSFRILMFLSVFFGLLIDSFGQWVENGNGTELQTDDDVRVTGKIRSYDGSDYVLLQTSDANNYSRIMWGDNGNDRLSFYYNYWNGSSSDKEVMTLRPNGNVGIGITNPGVELDISGDARVSYGNKFLIEHSNSVTSEMFITGHGQGAGWMINASYSGSGNPQTNATFDVNQGSYNTGAGYLDFDGNARMWSLNVSEGISAVDAPVTFAPLAVFRYNQYIKLSANGDEEDFYMKSGGNIGIGTTTPSVRLEVDGKIKSEEVKVEIIEGTGPDYVFEENYPLLSLEEVKTYISENKHLPEIPSAKEMEANGIELGQMNMLLLKKVEELTLHLIEQSQLNQAQQKLLNAQSTLINELQKEIAELKEKI